MLKHMTRIESARAGAGAGAGASVAQPTEQNISMTIATRIKAFIARQRLSDARGFAQSPQSARSARSLQRPREIVIACRERGFVRHRSSYRRYNHRRHAHLAAAAADIPLWRTWVRVLRAVPGVLPRRRAPDEATAHG